MASARRKLLAFYLPILCGLASCLSALAQKPFDSKRDPEQDLLAAKDKATQEHKNIFLDFGGNWCEPCLMLDAALNQDSELATTLEHNFVVVHVAVGILSSSKKVNHLREQLPKFHSYPHVIVLTADGTVLHDEVKGDFMTNADGKGIDHKVLDAFLEKWSPQKQ